MLSVTNEIFYPPKNIYLYNPLSTHVRRNTIEEVQLKDQINWSFNCTLAWHFTISGDRGIMKKCRCTQLSTNDILIIQ